MLCTESMEPWTEHRTEQIETESLVGRGTASGLAFVYCALPLASCAMRDSGLQYRVGTCPRRVVHDRRADRWASRGRVYPPMWVPVHAVQAKLASVRATIGLRPSCWRGGSGSGRRMMYQFKFNLLFRWFVGLGIDGPLWHPPTFTTKFDRVLADDVAARLPIALLDYLEFMRFWVRGTSWLPAPWSGPARARRASGLRTGPTCHAWPTRPAPAVNSAAA